MVGQMIFHDFFFHFRFCMVTHRWGSRVQCVVSVGIFRYACCLFVEINLPATCCNWNLNTFKTTSNSRRTRVGHGCSTSLPSQLWSSGRQGSCMDFGWFRRWFRYGPSMVVNFYNSTDHYDSGKSRSSRFFVIGEAFVLDDDGFLRLKGYLLKDPMKYPRVCQLQMIIYRSFFQ